MAPEETDDRLLVERLRRGDQRSWCQVMNAYRNGIYLICVRRIGHRADAEEICSAVFDRAARSIGGFRGDSSFKTWLHRIAANFCSTALTSRGGREHVSLE